MRHIFFQDLKFLYHLFKTHDKSGFLYLRSLFSAVKKHVWQVETLLSELCSIRSFSRHNRIV